VEQLGADAVIAVQIDGGARVRPPVLGVHFARLGADFGLVRGRGARLGFALGEQGRRVTLRIGRRFRRIHGRRRGGRSGRKRSGSRRSSRGRSSGSSRRRSSRRRSSGSSRRRSSRRRSSRGRSSRGRRGRRRCGGRRGRAGRGRGRCRLREGEEGRADQQGRGEPERGSGGERRSGFPGADRAHRQGVPLAGRGARPRAADVSRSGDVVNRGTRPRITRPTARTLRLFDGSSIRPREVSGGSSSRTCFDEDP
jgi:hypothetical protein